MESNETFEVSDGRKDTKKWEPRETKIDSRAERLDQEANGSLPPSQCSTIAMALTSDWAFLGNIATQKPNETTIKHGSHSGHYIYRRF